MAALDISIESKVVKLGANDCTVAKLKEKEVAQFFEDVQQLTNDRACKEKPFGKDEFPDMDYFEDFIEGSITFLVRDTKTRYLEGFVSITPSFYHRFNPPLYAEITFGVMKQPADVTTYIALANIGVQYAKGKGYKGVICDTFTSNITTIKAVRELGFLAIANIPKSGIVDGQGWTETYVMFRKLVDDTQWADQSIEEKSNLPKLRRKEFEPRPRLTYLPRKFTLPSGKEVVLCYLNESHIKDVYDLLQDAAARGAGYGMGDVPSWEECTMVATDTSAEVTHHCLVAELDGKAVCFTCVSPVIYAKSAKPTIMDNYMVVDPSIAGKGVGTLFCSLYHQVTHDIGCEGALTDTYLVNTPVVRLVRTTGMRVVGGMPNGGYLKGRGWSDTITFYKDVTSTEVKLAKL